MAAELVLRDINLRFGGIKVLQDVSMAVESGRIFGLVGPNGAGKTSLFNCISGHYRASSGSITIDGVETSGKSASQMTKFGLARTFQHPALQLHETVLENVLLGAHSTLAGGPVSWALRMPWTTRSEKAARTEAAELLERLGLGDVADTPAGELSPGLHKTIELVRALLSKPRLLLLDEPAAGLSHTEVEAFIASIRGVRDDFDLTIVIVEHHMGLISAVTDRVMVLDHGATLMEGTAREAQSDPRVIEAYLGQASTAEVSGEPAGA
ncbi:ABC transporter ATP-binding protein [Naasia lichenicola]|uniref:ABC transporter ATP-binding protein n=1 Tax=Naasia lichenicola TaxID=2565933 RepID=UPI0018EE76F9|nr:ABC transporter ATP-binding protein [Naasia lichenicola]